MFIITWAFQVFPLNHQILTSLHFFSTFPFHDQILPWHETFIQNFKSMIRIWSGEAYGVSNAWSFCSNFWTTIRLYHIILWSRGSYLILLVFKIISDLFILWSNSYKMYICFQNHPFCSHFLFSDQDQE